MKRIITLSFAFTLLVPVAMTAQNTSKAPVSSKTFVEALLAEGPTVAYKKELMLYGQFIGTWDIVIKATIPNQPVKTTTSVWVFHWILEGRGIQDVIIPGGDHPATGFGTTLRMYDSKTDTWKIYWADPIEGRYTYLTARNGEGKIIQKGEFKPGVPMRWIFFDISKNHFQWRNDISFDGGKTWITVQHIEAVRDK